MKDSLPTVWPADQHTEAKHRILTAYLNAFMPILSRQSHKVGAKDVVRYIDGFAGPGIYEKGQKGSPVLALDAALNHAHSFPVPVELTFIEADSDRCDVLSKQLELYDERVKQSPNVILKKPVCGDCRTVLGSMIDGIEQRRQKLGPALVFLDQFGYSSVSMELIGRILNHPQCEVLTYLFFRDLGRFITDTTKHASITNAFGDERWRPAIDLPAGKRESFMLAAYVSSLKEKAKATYVWPFAMLDQNERLLYWLFFCTNNIRGLEEMKKAMWKVDETGSFTFNDKDGFSQPKFLSSYTEDHLAKDLERGLAGRTLKVEDVNEWVLVHTPAYKFKGALATLEKRGVLKAVNPSPTRRAGQYSDEKMRVSFDNPPLFPMG